MTRFDRDSLPVVVPETDVHRVLLWANKRNRPEILDEYRIEVDVAPVSITIFECRPPWRPLAGNFSWTRFPIARLRYTKSKKTWTLYWRDRNLKFHLYEATAPSESLDEYSMKSTRTAPPSSGGEVFPTIGQRRDTRPVLGEVPRIAHLALAAQRVPIGSCGVGSRLQ